MYANLALGQPGILADFFLFLGLHPQYLLSIFLQLPQEIHASILMDGWTQLLSQKSTQVHKLNHYTPQDTMETNEMVKPCLRGDT